MASNGRHTENLRKRLQAINRTQTNISGGRAKNIHRTKQQRKAFAAVDAMVEQHNSRARERGLMYRGAKRSRANDITRR